MIMTENKNCPWGKIRSNGLGRWLWTGQGKWPINKWIWNNENRWRWMWAGRAWGRWRWMWAGRGLGRGF